MSSTYSPLLRLDYQAPGDNLNTWGLILNTGVFQLLETAVAGRLAFTLSGLKTLTTDNGDADEARNAILDITGGTGGTITIPSLSKLYVVRNATTGDVIITTGAGTTATIATSNIALVFCDGANVYPIQQRDFGGAQITNIAMPLSDYSAATKKYVDDTAFSSMAGTLPGQTGNSGKFLTTDGTDPAWDSPYPSQAGNSGKILTTNGSSTSWLALGTVTDVLTGTSTAPITGDALYDSAAPVALTDAATVAWNTNDGYNAYVILGGNRIIGQPTNLRSGITYTLEVVQDATGSRVPTWNAVWDFGAAGTPVLQTSANKADKIIAQYNARTSKLDASFRKGA